LAVLYYATGDDDWGQEFASYLQPWSVCEWNNGNPWGSDNPLGIHCATQSSVQHIRLLGFGLSGTVPWELSLLESLVVLDLSAGLLTGTLPSELGGFRELEEFFIYQKRFTNNFRHPTSWKTLWVYLVHKFLAVVGNRESETSNIHSDSRFWYVQISVSFRSLNFAAKCLAGSHGYFYTQTCLPSLQDEPYSRFCKLLNHHVFTPSSVHHNARIT
jgi:hypothetical protein